MSKSDWGIEFMIIFGFSSFLAASSFLPLRASIPILVIMSVIGALFGNFYVSKRLGHV
jgi:hypothetical protein